MASQLWQRLRAARKFADLTQAQLAAACGITRSGYAFFEASDPGSRSRPNTDQIMAIAKLTRVPIDWLLNDASEPGDVWKIGVVAGVAPKQQAQPPQINGGAFQRTIDRAEDTFWRAVEYNVMMSNSDMASCFDVPIDVLSIQMRVRFLSDRVLACFTSHTDEQSLLFYLGRLLLAERATGSGRHKHLIVWNRADINLDDISNAAQRMFAVTIKAVHTAEEAAAYLVSQR